nr:reverse transcriptase domain-containing protein [Tanacetum cinerariifolium]
MFDHQDLFLPEEILSPQKRARSRSSSSTSTLPQVFEIGESSHKISLEHHEEHIETILNHLDELPLECIEHMEEKVEGLGNGRVIIQRDFDQLETELQEARTQISGFQREKIRHDDEIVLAHRMAPNRTSTSATPAINQAAIRKLVADSVAAALEAQASNMTNIDNTNRNTEEREDPVARKCSYKKEAYNITWSEFKKLLIKKYYPQTEIKKIEDEFYNLTVKGNDLKTYIRGFQELAVLCPTMVPNSEKLMQVFIEGLPRSIKGNVTASKPQTLKEAITITQRLMDQVTKHNSMQGTNDHKRKFDDRRTFTNNDYQNNRNNNSNHNNDHQQQQNKRQETLRAYTATSTENKGNCRNKGPATESNLQSVLVTCHACGEKRHYRNQCPKANNNAHGRAYLLRDKNAHQDPNVVMAQVMEKKLDEKLLEDIPVVREFLEVFPEDLPGLPPVRQVEFQIYLIPGAAPVVRAPYRLAPSELRELSDQLQELTNRDYDCEIRYHPRKANVIADALSQKERIKPLRVRALVMTLHLKLPSQILEAQTEAIKEENIKAENL